MIPRETVMNALLTAVAATAEFRMTARRLRRPESIGPKNSPALFVLDGDEEHANQAPGLPTRRTLSAELMIYNDVGDDEKAIPVIPINNALDNIEALLAQADPMTGRYTLGGLVFSIKIDGRILKSPGDVTGKSVARVPLRIILP